MGTCVGERVWSVRKVAFENICFENREHLKIRVFFSFPFILVLSIRGAARDNVSSVVEVRQRPIDAIWRYHLDVIVDGQRIYFDRYSQKIQQFRGEWGQGGGRGGGRGGGGEG